MNGTPFVHFYRCLVLKKIHLFKSFSAMIAGLCLFSLEVSAKKTLSLVTEIYPPYQTLSAKNQVEGVATQIVKRIFKEAELDYKIEFLPWARAYNKALIEPDVFIFSMMKLSARQDSFIWLAPLCDVNVSFYKLKGRQEIVVQSLDDAKKYRIGVGRNQGNFIFLKNNGFEINQNLIVVNNNEQLRKMLVHNRIDLILTTDGYITEMIKNKAVYAAMLEREYTVDSLKQTLYLAANKASSPELIDKLTTAYQQLPKSVFKQCTLE
jgi:polar amino acid transport system substrate-binding protein